MEILEPGDDLERAAAPAPLPARLMEAWGTHPLSYPAHHALACALAALIPEHPRVETSVQEAVDMFVESLGGLSAAVSWLDQFPGPPRLRARTLTALDVLLAFHHPDLPQWLAVHPAPTLTGVLPRHHTSASVSNAAFEVMLRLMDDDPAVTYLLTELLELASQFASDADPAQQPVFDLVAERLADL